MPNWKRTPPINGMTIEEIKKRAKAGIENRRKLGLLPPADMKIITTTPDGPVLTKKQRRVMVRATDLAVYSMANLDREDYCAAAETINAVRRQCGMTSAFMGVILSAVVDMAAELNGEDSMVLDQLSRFWLNDYFNPSDKLISIPKGKANGNGKKQTHN